MMKIKPLPQNNQGLIAFICFFKAAASHNYSEGGKLMADFIAAFQKSAKIQQPLLLEDRVKFLYTKVLKKDYVDMERSYYALSFIKEKDLGKNVLLIKLCKANREYI